MSGPGNKVGKSSIRPTSDRVREAIFNILGARSVVESVLDLYAGTGALGIEALSRGSHFGTFVDHDSKAVGLIKKNLDVCGFGDRSAVLQRDIARGLGFLKKIGPRPGYDLVFLDPPYNMGSTVGCLQALDEHRLIMSDGFIVVEDATGVDLPECVKNLELTDSRKYGGTSVWIYQNTRVSEDK